MRKKLPTTVLIAEMNDVGIDLQPGKICIYVPDISVLNRNRKIRREILKARGAVPSSWGNDLIIAVSATQSYGDIKRTNRYVADTITTMEVINGF